MSSTPRTISRRWFLKVGAAFALMRATARGQVPMSAVGSVDLPFARKQLIDLVNTERSQVGLSPLQLDDLACQVANEHARDMANGRFLSHWGSDGRKPYQRYSFAGGIDATQENVSAADNILSLTPNGVAGDLVDMHTAMHAEKPPNDGHRQAILAFHHTHAGFGIALSGHSLRLSELYVSRYLEVNAFPQKAKRGTTVILTGKLLNPAHFLHEVDVFFEPLPAPPSADWLRTPRGYALPDEYVGLRPQAPHGAHYGDGSTGDYEWGSNGKFRVPAKLSRDVPPEFTRSCFGFDACRPIEHFPEQRFAFGPNELIAESVNVRKRFDNVRTRISGPEIPWLTFVISFHHIGQELSGVMEITAFAEIFYLPTEEDSPIPDEVRCMDKPFTITHEDEPQAVRNGLLDWANECFTLAVKSWGDVL